MLRVSFQARVLQFNLHKAFDRIRRGDTWKSLKKRKINEETVEVIKSMYKDNIHIVRINNEELKEFKTEIGVT